MLVMSHSRQLYLLVFFVSAAANRKGSINFQLSVVLKWQLLQGLILCLFSRCLSLNGHPARVNSLSLDLLLFGFTLPLVQHQARLNLSASGLLLGLETIPAPRGSLGALRSVGHLSVRSQNQL